MIEIINAYKSFTGHQVLNGANLTIRDGETMVIIGRSGCGKTVLLRHMIGLVQPDSGQVIVDGQEVSQLSGPTLEDRKSTRLNSSH